METKISKLRAAMAANDWILAMRIAAKFPRLGAEKAAITRAHDAKLRPDFYRQIGKNPCALFEEGKAALVRRYGEVR